MQKYRFFKTDLTGKWYLLPPTIDGPNEFMQDPAQAGQFIERDWEWWARDAGYEREELGEDQVMRLAGAQPLPGFED